MAQKSKITTIKLEEETKKRLDGLKEHQRESYNDVIKKALSIINITIKNPAAGASIFRRIKIGRLPKQQVYLQPRQKEKQASRPLY